MSKISTSLRLLKTRWAALVHDVIMIPVAWMLAYWIRYKIGEYPDHLLERALDLLPLVVLIQGSTFIYFGLYRGIWRFASLPDLSRIVRAVVVSTAMAAVVIFFLTRLEYVPRSVFIIDAIVLILLLGGTRLSYRLIKDHSLAKEAAERVLVVGAGSAGEGLVRDLLRMRPAVYAPVAFVDDDPAKQGQEIHGIRVVSNIESISSVAGQWDADLIMLALPSASSDQMRRIVEICEMSGLPFRTLPKLQSLVSGKVSINEIREVQIEDLLGRAPVMLDRTEIVNRLKDKTVLVTGGGGSIGSELCRQISKVDIQRLIVLDQSEYNLYSIEKELQQSLPDLQLSCELGDVCDLAGLEYLFKTYQPDVVFHAAAYKHVPMLEDKIRVAVRNNVIGSWNVASLADKYNCSDFVMVSTDKAVNPGNIMGATKRVAEIICQTMDERSTTRFITTRFGNVLGSAGSVVPLFRKQIQKGGPVTVTDKNISRYFMTISEACRLILQTTVMGNGGEIFVLDMGEPVKVLYLAEQMIRLSGKIPGEDIKIEFTGLRPGEKLHEELFHSDEDLTDTSHEKVMLAMSRKTDWPTLVKSMGEFQQAVDEFNMKELKKLICKLVPEMTQQHVSKKVEGDNAA
ncbi:MAG: polysaccharide biosynthesis protein [Gammaproteobacteria bacterium]|nr:polysaccharide biosynthesis protein [Gammaproteobacteria bacterium]